MAMALQGSNGRCPGHCTGCLEEHSVMVRKLVNVMVDIKLPQTDFQILNALDIRTQVRLVQKIQQVAWLKPPSG